MKNKQHLFFDLDRTLWDFDKNARETLSELYEEFQLHNDIENFDHFHDAYVEENEACWKAYREGNLHKNELRSIRFKNTLERFYINNHLLADTLGEEYLKRCPLKPHLVDDAKAVLQHMAEKFTLHIITNGFETTQHTKLNNADLKQYFSEIITSEKAQAKKPHPDIFHFALSESKVEVGNSVMIGDDYDADILGASTFGMDNIWLNVSGQKKELPHNTKEIAQLNELIAIFS